MTNNDDDIIENTIIPAYPGYTFLVRKRDANNNLIGISRLPVLAWAINNGPCPECDVQHVDAITYYGPEGLGYGALQLPDGSITLPFEDIDIKSEADLLAFWKKKNAEAEAGPDDIPCSATVN